MEMEWKVVRVLPASIKWNTYSSYFFFFLLYYHMISLLDMYISHISSAKNCYICLHFLIFFFDVFTQVMNCFLKKLDISSCSPAIFAPGYFPPWSYRVDNNPHAQFKERSVPLQTPSRFGKVGHHSRAGIIALFKTTDVCRNVFWRFLNHVQMEEIENF